MRGRQGGGGGAIFVPGRGGPDNGRFCAQLSLTMKEQTKAKKPRHAPELVCFTTEWWQRKKNKKTKEKEKKERKKDCHGHGRCVFICFVFLESA